MSKPFFLAQALSISLVLSLVSHKRERSWAHCVLLPSPNNLASSPASLIMFASFSLLVTG